MSDVQERILSDVGQDPQKGEAAVLEALGWLAAGLTVLIDSHSLDHLPTRKAVIRMLRQGEQGLARYGDLREKAGREDAERKWKAIMDDADRLIGLCGHGFLKCFYCWRDAGFPGATSR